MLVLNRIGLVKGLDEELCKCDNPGVILSLLSILDDIVLDRSTVSISYKVDISVITSSGVKELDIVV